MRATSSRPRLLIVNTTNRRRGAEVQSIRIRHALEMLGWSVDIVSLTTQERDPTIEAIPLSSRSPDDHHRMHIDVAAGLLRFLRRGDYDLVLGNGSATLRYLATVGRFAVRRSRLGYVAIGEPSYWMRTRSSRTRMRLLLRSVGWVLAVSEATAAEIHSIGGPDLEVDVVLSGVPPELFDIDPARPEGPLHVLVMGSLTREKDPEAALEVIAESEIGANLRFVGSGPLESQVAATAQRLGLSDRVEIRGSQADVAEDLAWAHVLLFTSRTEGLPGVVLEAAAAGLPTLGFDVGGTREVVHDRSTGRLLAAGDRRGLAKALAELAASDELRTSWGANARQMVRENFLIEHVAVRYDRALRQKLPL